MAATTQYARWLSGTVAALIGIFGWSAQATPIRAQSNVTTPAPNTLFHDDFTTQADRWKLVNLGQKASIGYDVQAGTLDVAVGAASYALWSIPDTDLALDQADMRVEADWSAGVQHRPRVGTSCPQASRLSPRRPDRRR